MRQSSLGFGRAQCQTVSLCYRLMALVCLRKRLEGIAVLLLVL
jgi:hypothetical protein